MADPTIRERLRELAEKATPGPWVRSWFVDGPEYAHMSGPWKKARQAEEERLIRAIGPKGLHIAVMEDGWGEGTANAALIVESVNALPALLDELDTLERRAIAAESALEACSFKRGWDDWQNCRTHGWTGFQSEVRSTRQCPKARAALEASRGSA